MTRPDDSSLTNQQLANVQKHVDRLLRDAAAYETFPTPIADLIAAAKLTIVDDELLDEGMLHRFLRKGAARAATLKSALSKVLGLFDARDKLIVIDKNLPRPKKPFVKLHEVGHGVLPHQSVLYALMQDCEKTLDPDTTDLFEREANVFASEALFQGELFSEIAHSEEVSIKVPMGLATKFGASNYSSFRRYAQTSPRACCVVVVEPLTFRAGGAFSAPLRRVVASVLSRLGTDFRDAQALDFMGLFSRPVC